MHEHDFGSLTRIRILLVPVGSVHRSLFDKWADEIRGLSEIRLSDVPPDTREERGRFMPNPLANGSLLLSFPRHPPPHSRSGLNLFRPSEFPLGVIGIAGCSQLDDLSSIYTQFTGAIAEIFPPDSKFPLAKNCLVFEEGDGNTNLNVGDQLPGLVVIPSMMGNKKLYIETLLAELCSNILGEFSVIVKGLETTSGNESLNASLFATFAESLNPPLSLEGDESYRSAHGNLAQHSQPEVTSNAASSQQSDLSRFPLRRVSTLGPSVTTHRNSGLLASSSRKRQSTAPPTTSHARLFKILGDLFLLAGRTMDSTIWYNEALVLLKQPQDMPWQAAALEGIAVGSILDTFSANHASASNPAQLTESWNDISEKLSRASSLYSGSAALCESEASLSDLAFLYVDSCLRHASFLYSIWAAKGWNPSAINLLLRGEKPSYLTSAGTNTPEVSRSDVSTTLAQAHGPWILHLGPRERIEMLEFITRIYSQLGYRRKEAYVLRELVSCLMDLVVHGRDEARSPSEVTPALADSPTAQAYVRNQSNVGVREKVDISGNASILQLVKYVCEVHGVDLGVVKFSEIADESATDTLHASLPSPHYPYQWYVRTAILRHSWSDLQIGMIRESLAVAEALPDYHAVAVFALSALSSLTPLLDAEDQYHFYTVSARAMATARRRGDELRLRYWPGDLVVNIKFMPPPFTRIPLERPWTSKQAGPYDESAKGRAGTDPFLYNPKRVLAPKRQSLVVQGESLEFVVTLQNPLSIALELLQISLSTSGVSFTSNATSAILQPNSYQNVTLSGRALEPGVLVIRGCIIHLPGTEPHETLLPLLSDEDEEKRYFRAVAAVNEAERLKRPALADRLNGKEKRISITPSEREDFSSAPKYMELKVVPEQPFMRIRRTSLTNGAVMLYEGETSVMRLTLENISALPIDFLELAFEDSVKSYAEQALADMEMSVFDTHETEYSLVHRPVFSWDPSTTRTEILPGKENTIAITCFGKAGCTNGAVQISYSYTRSQGDALEHPEIYTRHLHFPVLVSVYQMLECSGMNVLPFSALEIDGDEFGGEEWRALLKDVDEYAWCAFALDVQNTYGLPFEVTLLYSEKVSTRRIVPPGSTYRILLPIERFSLPASTTTAPIPSLTNRQFVVTGLANDVDMAQRELFWYREELLKRVKANWKEATGSRMGELSLRQQRFTQTMLNVLRTEQIRVSLLLSHSEETRDDALTKPVGSTGVTFSTLPNEFVYVTTQVQNSTTSPLVLTLTLDIQPSDYIAYDAVLRNIPLGRIGSQELTECRSLVAFVAQGQFNISAQVRVIEPGKEAVVGGSGKIRVISRNSESCST